MDNTNISQITRFDRNLALNIKDFDQYGLFSSVAKDLVVYIAFKYNDSKDLWNNGRLDPYEFIKYSKLHRENLFKNVKASDIGMKELPCITIENQDYVLDTVLELTLYNMLEKSLILKNGYTTFEGHKELKFSSIKILEDLTVTIDKKGKRIYYYKPNQYFLNNLARVFVQLNIAKLPEYRQKKVYDLYFYLLALQNTLIYKKSQGIIEEGTPNFNYLCNIADITTSTDNSVYLKRKLTKKIETLIADANLLLLFRWGKTQGDNYNYKPIFSLITDKNTKDYSEIIFKEMDERCNHVFKRNAENIWEEAIKNTSNLTFEEWFNKKELNKKEKAMCYVDAYNVVYNKTIDLKSKIILKNFGDF